MSESGIYYTPDGKYLKGYKSDDVAGLYHNIRMGTFSVVILPAHQANMVIVN